MRLKVEIESEMEEVENRVFWTGDSSEIGDIQNTPARMVAAAVREDGKTRKWGMWKVSKLEDVE